jgi:hypothetical protein
LFEGMKSRNKAAIKSCEYEAQNALQNAISFYENSILPYVSGSANALATNHHSTKKQAINRYLHQVASMPPKLSESGLHELDNVGLFEDTNFL